MSPYSELNLKKAIADGRTPGPRMHVTGPYLTGAGASSGMHAVSTAEEARRVVSYWAEEGATWLKFYTGITREAMKAVIDEAHCRGVKVTGHLCSVGFREAVSLGIDNLEHGLQTNSEYDPNKVPDRCPSTMGASLRALDMNSAPVQANVEVHAAAAPSSPVLATVATGIAVDITGVTRASGRRSCTTACRGGSPPKALVKVMPLGTSPCASGSSMEAGLQPDTIKVHRAVCACSRRCPAISARVAVGEHRTGRAVDIMVYGGNAHRLQDCRVRPEERSALGISQSSGTSTSGPCSVPAMVGGHARSRQRHGQPHEPRARHDLRRRRHGLGAPMLRVGLTGGIGSGKSTVSALLASHGAVVIDYDELARAVVEPGSPALTAIGERFGRRHRAGRIARPAGAGRVVFADPKARADLERITHPAIRELAVSPRSRRPPRRDRRPRQPAAGRDGGGSPLRRGVVVDVPEEVQVARLVGDRGMSESDARARIAAQASEKHGPVPPIW